MKIYKRKYGKYKYVGTAPTRKTAEIRISSGMYGGSGSYQIKDKYGKLKGSIKQKLRK